MSSSPFTITSRVPSVSTFYSIKHQLQVNTPLLAPNCSLPDKRLGYLVVILSVSRLLSLDCPSAFQGISSPEKLAVVSRADAGLFGE